LTAAGAQIVNDGGDLPNFTVGAESTSGQTSSDSANVNPADTDLTDDGLTVTVTNVIDDINEGEATTSTVVGNASSTNPDGSTVTLSIDNPNYEIDSNGEITLTADGVALVNSGQDLPDFTVDATSTTGDTGTSANVNPADTDLTAPDTPVVTITEDTNDDGFISNNELSGNINVSISIPDGSVVGDTINVTINGATLPNGDTTYEHVLTNGDLTNNSISIQLKADEGSDIKVTATITDTAGNISEEGTDSATIDTTASNIDELSITNIIDHDGDHSSITMYGTGAEVGNTITLIDEDGNEVATTIVQSDGTWSTEITSLDNTPINDNEFFSATETDPAGNETGQTDTTHFNAFDWNNAQTDNFDDYAMAGSGDDHISANDNDLNDYVVLDGGDGNDSVTFTGNISDYAITTDENGYTIVAENNSSDSDGDGTGDVNELRNVETIIFGDGQTLDLTDNTVSAPSLNLNITENILTEDVVNEIRTEVEMPTNDVELTRETTVIDSQAMVDAGYVLVQVPTVLVEKVDGSDFLGDTGGNHWYSNSLQEETSTHTLSFGNDHAGETIVLTFDTQVKGGWEDGTNAQNGQSNNETVDKFNIKINDSVVASKTYDEHDDSDNTWNESYSYEVVLNQNGEVKVDFGVASTHITETVEISNIQASLTTAGESIWMESTSSTSDINLNQAGATTGIISLGKDTDSVVIDIKSYKEDQDEGNIILYKDGSEVATLRIDDLYDWPNNTTDASIGIGGFIFDSFEVIHTGNAYGIGSNSNQFKVGDIQTPADPIYLTETYTEIVIDTAAIENLHVESDLTFTSEEAGYNNIVGTYEYDENGNPTNFVVIIDDQNNSTSGEDILDTNSDKGLFLIADGNDGITINENSVLTFDVSNNTILVDGNSVGINTFFSDNNLNIDGESHIRVDYNEDGSADIHFEDLVYGSAEMDRWDVRVPDFDDVILHAENTFYEVTNEIETVTTGYEYTLNLDADLTDTDSSEQLSDITLNNMPNNATLTDASGNEISVNADGTYTVTPDENGDATVTLSSTTSISEADLNSITSSVTSTELNGDDSVTVNQNDDITNIDGGDDDTFIMETNNIELDFDNIEAINVNTLDLGDGDTNNINVTNLDISDVLNMTGTDNILTITGDSGDQVSLDADKWDDGVVDGDFTTYTAYNGVGSESGLSEVQILIENNVEVTQG
ncbi:MAG: hypothetical protein U9N59_03560, partial [Campylobacterota bacterium]|nr:hypothetical protein [Campylobacterota bacterium]